MVLHVLAGVDLAWTGDRVAVLTEDGRIVVLDPADGAWTVLARGLDGDELQGSPDRLLVGIVRWTLVDAATGARERVRGEPTHSALRAAEEAWTVPIGAPPFEGRPDAVLAYEPYAVVRTGPDGAAHRYPVPGGIDGFRTPADPEGRRVAVVTDHGGVRLLDLEDGSVHGLPGSRADPHRIAFSPDGRFVAGLDADGVRIWPADGERLPEPPAARIAGLGFDDAARAWLVWRDGRVRVLDPAGTTIASGDVPVADEGQSVLVRGDAALVADGDGLVRRWEVEGDGLREVPGPIAAREVAGTRGGAFAVRRHNDLVVIGADGTERATVRDDGAPFLVGPDGCLVHGWGYLGAVVRSATGERLATFAGDQDVASVGEACAVDLVRHGQVFRWSAQGTTAVSPDALLGTLAAGATLDGLPSPLRHRFDVPSISVMLEWDTTDAFAVSPDGGRALVANRWGAVARAGTSPARRGSGAWAAPARSGTCGSTGPTCS